MNIVFNTLNRTDILLIIIFVFQLLIYWKLYKKVDTNDD